MNCELHLRACHDYESTKEEENVKILALDPATTCGWAHSDGPSGTWDLSVRKDESGGMRWIRFRGKLNDMLASVGVDLIVFEASRNLQYGNAIRVAAGLQATIEAWCVDKDKEYRGYSPKEIKKHATGKGNASKEQMKAAAKAKGWEVEDDNQADALWILNLAQSQF